MIAFIYRLVVGFALRILLTYPSGATRVRLLRKEGATADFTGEDDSSAQLVYEGTADTALDLDLPDDVAQTYKAYFLIDGAWVGSDSASATPHTSIASEFVDAYRVFGDVLATALERAAAKKLFGGSVTSVPLVFSMPTVEEAPFPFVSVHCENERPEVRAIGEVIAPLSERDDGKWVSSAGSLERWNLTFVVFAMNAVQRDRLRAWVRTALFANFDILNAFGIDLPEFSLSNHDDYETYNAPLFMVRGQFSCLAPAYVTGIEDALPDVVINLLR